MRFALGIVAAVSMAACLAPSSEDARADTAAVTASAPDAVSLMRSVWSGHDFDYLPWAYSPDGCFARSYFMSMEFASRGIPARQQIINLRWNGDFASNKAQFAPIDPAGQPVTYGGRDVHWQYHIAAVLVPGPEVALDQPMVIDRALEPGPVTVDKWVSDANSSHIPVAPPSDAPVVEDDKGLATRGYNQLKTKGAPYVGVGSFLNGNWASFEGEPERMPTYEASTIQIACNTVWTIWVDCMGADPEATTSMLSERANTLIGGLEAHQALTGEKPAAPMTCTRNDKFVCFGAAAPSPEAATSNALAE